MSDTLYCNCWQTPSHVLLTPLFLQTILPHRLLTLECPGTFWIVGSFQKRIPKLWTSPLTHHIYTTIWWSELFTPCQLWNISGLSLSHSYRTVPRNPSVHVYVQAQAPSTPLSKRWIKQQMHLRSRIKPRGQETNWNIWCAGGVLCRAGRWGVTNRQRNTSSGKKKKKDKHLLDWMLSHRNPSLFFFRGADGEANILHNLLRKYYLFLEVFPLSCLWRIKTWATCLHTAVLCHTR